jgi:hypothetical protein
MFFSTVIVLEEIEIGKSIQSVSLIYQRLWLAALIYNLDFPKEIMLLCIEWY